MKYEELDPSLPVRTVEEHNTYIKSIEDAHKFKLSILIATTTDRRIMFNSLCQEFFLQIEKAGFAGKGLEEWYVKVPTKKEDGTEGEGMAKARYRHKPLVELVHIEDNREMSIGSKRQKLLELSKGEYIVFFDSDDYPKKNYVKELVKAIETKPDCVGFKIAMTTNGEKPQTCIHSLQYKAWKTEGNTHYRNVTHFNCVRRDLALQVGFKDLRFGEDKDYSDRLTPLCKTEVFIDEFLFDYRYSNKQPHSEKYGIK